MSEIDPRTDVPLASWSEVGVNGLLPTGIVSLLLATVNEIVAAHDVQEAARHT